MAGACLLCSLQQKKDSKIAKFCFANVHYIADNNRRRGYDREFEQVARLLTASDCPRSNFVHYQVVGPHFFVYQFINGSTFFSMTAEDLKRTVNNIIVHKYIIDIK